ncbi:MAG: acyltransferase [Lachnospiraceae bacterium]|nr:acyltransferase [Lachnospiraceae bacterium]
MKKKGMISIDTAYFLRGIAALMVIFSHFFEWSAERAGSESLSRFMMALGDPGVGIFFFLSGYALYKSCGEKKTDRVYLFKKIKSVYIPFIIIDLIKDIYRGEFTENTPETIRNMLIAKDFWFIQVILLIYLAWYFIGKLPKYRLTIMTLFILNLSLYLKLRGYQIFWYDANWAFAAGMIFSKYETKIPAVKNGAVLEIKDYVFCFLGKLSLYVYLLHGFLYLEMENSAAVQRLIPNWYLRVLLSTIAIAAASFLVERGIHYLYAFTGKLFNRIFNRQKEPDAT